MTLQMRLYLALRSLVPYAENEVASLHDTARRDLNTELEEEAKLAQSVLDIAKEILECYEEANPEPISDRSIENHQRLRKDGETQSME